ncbi:MAG: hypothetical protein ACYSYM_14890 [Planctomycetota bacterium]|jgi:hypothetical protein
MARQERAIFNDWDNNNDFWQYRCSQTQSPAKRPPQLRQTSARTDNTALWFWILGTIGFCALIAIKTLWSY